MSIARVTEIKAASSKSFDDAIQQGIARANETIDHIRGAWVSEQDMSIEDGKITEYRVLLKLTFVLK